jgi:hypothetical protein
MTTYSIYKQSLVQKSLHVIFHLVTSYHGNLPQNWFVSSSEAATYTFKCTFSPKVLFLIGCAVNTSIRDPRQTRVTPQVSRCCCFLCLTWLHCTYIVHVRAHVTQNVVLWSPFHENSNRKSCMAFRRSRFFIVLHQQFQVNLYLSGDWIPSAITFAFMQQQQTSGRQSTRARSRVPFSAAHSIETSN